MGRTVWIDLENSPHVVFFRPWISWLREEGHEVLLTARDLSQTQELLRLYGLEYVPVGAHVGGGKLAKGLLSLRRAAALARWARGRRLHLALGHGSRAQVLAAAGLRIPSLTFVDYEFVSLRLFGLFCERVFVPDCVPPEILRARGIPSRKLVSYPGVKELVYLDPEMDRGTPETPPVIVVRPPASQAHYHAVSSEVLYARLLDRLGQEGTGTRVVLLPRYREDIPRLRALAQAHPHFTLPEDAVDGRALLRSSSLVVSGGGTMVREAAVLNVPAASYFGGPLGGVDRALVEMGRLILLRTEEDVDALALPGSPRPMDGRPDVPPEGARPDAPAEHARSDSATGRVQSVPTVRTMTSCQVTREFLHRQVKSWLVEGPGEAVPARSP